MNATKADQSDMSEAWNQVGKAVNQATELYLKQLDTYLEWVGNLRRGLLEQALTATKQLSQIGEAEFAFLARMQKDHPMYGVIPAWTEVLRSAAGTQRPASERGA